MDGQMTVEPNRAAPAGLPHSFWAAAARGLRCRCPRCGEGPLFARWLQVEPACPACGQDWSHQRADDFPAYIAILITGHLLAPVMIMLALDYDLSPLGMALILFPSAIAMMLGLLQPAKGWVVALQWWHGMHGFVRERPAPDSLLR
jgi:uncharacterized protein (DUF983 family)